MPHYEVKYRINGQESTNHRYVSASSEKEAKDKIRKEEESKGYSCVIVSVRPC